jgi:carbohydrate-selective porin OprB
MAYPPSATAIVDNFVVFRTLDSLTFRSRGRSHHGREDILETYYTARLWRGLSAAGGLQYIDHPGYNQDRGPVLVRMLRLHVDF